MANALIETESVMVLLIVLTALMRKTAEAPTYVNLMSSNVTTKDAFLKRGDVTLMMIVWMVQTKHFVLPIHQDHLVITMNGSVLQVSKNVIRNSKTH